MINSINLRASIKEKLGKHVLRPPPHCWTIFLNETLMINYTKFTHALFGVQLLVTRSQVDVLELRASTTEHKSLPLQWQCLLHHCPDYDTPSSLYHQWCSVAAACRTMEDC